MTATLALRLPRLLCHSALGLAAATPLAAAQGDGGARPVPVRVVTVASDSERAALAGWAGGQPLMADGPATAGWLGIWLAPGQPRAKTLDHPWELELSHSAWLPGSPAGGNGELARWLLPDGVALPFDTLWLSRLGRGRLRAPEEASKDLLWLHVAGGTLDRRNGWLLGWHVDGLEFEGVAGPRRHPWDRIVGLQVRAEDLEPEGRGWVWLVLRHGGHLLVRPRDQGSETAAAAEFTVELPWGGEVSLPWDAVGALFRRDPPLRSLGELEAVRRIGPEAAVLDWTPRRGRSVEDGPLRVGGQEFAQGWGTRVPSEVAFRVSEGGRLFTWVGVDDEVAEFRNPNPVIFRVLLDGEQLAASPRMSAGQATHWLVADVPRAGELRLVAEPAGTLPFGGHANWLQPWFLPASAEAALRESG